MEGARIINFALMDSEKSTLQIQVNFDPKGQILRVTSGSNSKIFSKNH